MKFKFLRNNAWVYSTDYTPEDNITNLGISSFFESAGSTPVFPFTGLHDSAGNEIYLGDLYSVTDDGNTVYKVDFLDGCYVLRDCDKYYCLYEFLDGKVI